MTPDEMVRLEVAALAQLGLGSVLRGAGVRPGEPVLEALVRLGRLRRDQAEAVSLYVEQHATTCSCGQRALLPEETVAVSCAACGASLARARGGPVSVGRPSAPLAAGARLGPFELQEELGRGSFGAVFRARHVELGRLSALKVQPGTGVPEERSRRFEREVIAQSRLDHPGIVKIHSVLRAGGYLAFDMELVEGTTLEGRVAREGPLPWREAVALVQRIAEAMDHAHARGVVHRDLKPANVLLRQSDGSPVVADLGIARLLDEASSLTATGMLLGTPIYMAPEMAAERAATPAVDVYALGGILHFAITGRDPIDGTTVVIVLMKALAGDVGRIDVPGVPREVEAIRARAMSVDPALRHPDAGALARDLARVLRGESVAAPSRWRSALPAALLLAGLGAGLAWRLRPAAKPVNETHAGTAPARPGAGEETQGDALAFRGDPAGAVSAYGRALALDPLRRELHVKRAGVAALASDGATARADLDALALELKRFAAGEDPGVSLAGLAPALYARGLEGPAEPAALRDLELAARLAPPPATLAAAVARRWIDDVLGRNPFGAVAQAREGGRLLSNGDLDVLGLAVARLRRGCELGAAPGDARRVLEAFSELRLLSSKLPAAENARLAQHLLPAWPDQPHLLFVAARGASGDAALERVGQAASALPSFPADEPGEPASLAASLADFAIKLVAADASLPLASARKAVERTGSGRRWSLLARTALDRGDLAAASECQDLAESARAEGAHDDAEIAGSRVLLLIAQGRHDDAIALARRRHEAEPTSGTRRVLALALSKRPADQEELVRLFRPDRLDPSRSDDSATLALLASSLVALGRLPEARAAIGRLDQSERNKTTVAELRRALDARSR